MQYYVIGNSVGTAFLGNISSAGVSIYANYSTAIQLTTITMAEQFKAYCETVDPNNVFVIYEVTVTVNAVQVNQVGE